MDLDAKLAGIGLGRDAVTDPGEAWSRLHERYGRRATLIDRYELEALARGVEVTDLPADLRRRLALEVFRIRDPGFEFVAGPGGSDPIEVVDYDPRWPEKFEAWRARLAAALGPVAVRIDHVGSTAVPGLPAKPVIDIQVSVDGLDDEGAIVPAIESLGIMFRARETGHLYFRPPVQPPREVQVHVCTAGSAWEREHLLFRDHLRANPVARDRYARTKVDMARLHRDDRYAYNEAKQESILDLLEEAERWAAATGWSIPGTAR